MKAIIVEDSRIAREGLARMLQNHAAIEVVGEADHPIPALELIAKLNPDVIFLDVHMPGETGFDLLEKLNYKPQIIFTTAYSEYAIRSFDYNTIDYLLKPISQERLAIAIEKLIDSTIESKVEQKAPLGMSNKIFFKDDEKCHLVTLESIRYFESCKNYVRAFFNQESAFIKKSLTQIEERLPRHFFFRANRQFIVNLQAIRTIEEGIHDGYIITMDDGVDIDISRRQATELKEMLSL